MLRAGGGPRVAGHAAPPKAAQTSRTHMPAVGLRMGEIPKMPAPYVCWGQRQEEIGYKNIQSRQHSAGPQSLSSEREREKGAHLG